MTVSRPIVVDLFAGGGGASEGIRRALGVEVLVAVNHDPAAIVMHTANHPSTIHLCESVYDVDPRKAVGRRQVDLLWASPDCKHHSRAKGGKPRDQNIRGLAWIVVEWARVVRPRVICLENVVEWEEWGPLDADDQPIKERAGETFRQWVAALELLGYRVEWRRLVAADYGTPTTRKRLFLVARCDGQPIAWPDPTHTRAQWRTAAECIDWSIPCPSVFERKKPLAEATQRRIAEGVRRYVLEAKAPGPFLINTRNGEREGQSPRTRDLYRPLGTVTAQGSQGALVVAAFIAKHYGGVVGQPLTRPLGTVTAQDHHSLVTVDLAHGTHAREVAAFLTLYYGSGGQHQAVDEPLRTIVSKARFGLVEVELQGWPYVLTDIGMRMLQPRELARAQGFDDSYILTGTKTEQIARIGNSVCPLVAEAVVRAQFPEQAARMAA